MEQVINASHSKDFVTYAHPSLIINRFIIDITYTAGSYGMGGYGFLGFQLSPTEKRKQEWLICTIFSASDWFTVNGRWLSCHPAQYPQQQPLMGTIYDPHTKNKYSSPLKTWDDFKPLILNKKISQFDCKKNSCQMIIEENIIAINPSSNNRPPFYGSRQPRDFDEKDDLRKAWILAREIYLYL
ncbi:hypothetical protein IQ215_05255 [Cyanobacterium stanieri LEGE 03274]|uniref:Uncharacterized protein n=1 Tax=Cyanobacterium stanieri LEGE 03274 TaxID=1828756 RepID=A0ABR9V2H2_9CHRO|nr:hypothetical protein [Cyanobacterium stanieri]MBE9222100.1 hypothetical protein [Cyanobacterium stanieri LEGE 03274]